jgi:GNAT superfamily N-acetyltransferase
MASFRIRESVLPDDREAFLSFIMGTQKFEHGIEPDRRLDPQVAQDYLANLVADVAGRNGKIYVAVGDDGARLGWGVAHEEENDIYVVKELRLHGYISELFVVEEMRGHGVGRALIEACEAWAKVRGLPLMMIGVLSGNTRAKRIYESSGYAHYALRLRKKL